MAKPQPAKRRPSENLVAVAFERHRAGDLARAEDAYRRVLAANPRHIEALHLLGLILSQTQRLDEGLQLLDRALALKPDHVDALVNRGNARQALKRYEAALEDYDKAVRCKPALAQAWSNRGAALKALGRREEAVASYDKALALTPDYVDALFNRGNALRELGRPDAALASYDRALTLRPAHVEAWIQFAVALIALKRFAEAAVCCDKALALRPHLAEAHALRGRALRELGRGEAALAAYDQAVAIRPAQAETWVERGALIAEMRRFEPAVQSFERALALAPEHIEAALQRADALVELRRFADAIAAFDAVIAFAPANLDAWTHRAVALTHLRSFDAALASYDRALWINPEHAAAFNNRGGTLRAMKRFEESMASYDRALTIRPDYPDAVFNRSLLSLLHGDFESGWRGYEARWTTKHRLLRRLERTLPIWRGEACAGKRIVVYDEQGFGDVLQFCRYVAPLAERGAQLTLFVRPSLVALLQDLPARVTSILDQAETFDFQCPLMSLPLAFGTTPATIPAPPRYLSADPARAARWAARIGASGFKVGVAWEGSDEGRAYGKSFALSELFSLAQLPDVRLISLQKGPGAEQTGALPQGMTVETLGEDFDCGPDAFLDTAAVIESLDLVVSIDTSIAHLAGALGRPVWVALPFVADWRWRLDRADTDWYPTMRLFRQHAWDDWRSAIADIEQALRARLGADS